MPNPVLMRRVIASPATGVGDPLRALFANGETGFLFDDFSDLTRLFTTFSGPTNVAADNDPAGLVLDRSQWGGKTLAQVLAAQTVLAASGYTLAAGGTGTATESPTGTINLTGDGTNFMLADKSFAAEVGVLYEVDFTGSAVTGFSQVGTTQGGNQTLTNQVTVSGTNRRYFVATATTHWLRFYKQAAGLFQASSIKVRKVPGNHGIQSANTGFRPLWKANSGKPYLTYDGSDDASIAPFIPTAATTLALAFRYSAGSVVSAILMGGGASTGNKRCYLAHDGATDRLGIGWGTEPFGTSNYGPALGATDHVAIITGDAVSRDVWLDGELLDSRAPTNGPDGTGGGVARGAYNNNGTSSNFALMREYASLAISRRVTPAEIAMITSRFRSKFQ